jgi:diguanylate cyclase (GGDEF)-like protein
MKNSKLQIVSILSVIGFFVILLGIAVMMTTKSNAEFKGILNDSIKSQLVSISIAARELIDADQFDSYNSKKDTETETYVRTQTNLRTLVDKVGASYICALKQIDGKYYFVFDTDIRDDTRFTEYKISPVHQSAFHGHDSADVFDLTDERGSFNTGAVPIWKNGKVIGIISTNIKDGLVKKSDSTGRTNTISLIAAMSISMCLMMIVVVLLMRRIRKIRDELFYTANYDMITGLPNRRYMMNYLESITTQLIKTEAPFALMFMDIDNFKTVNDNAGHDAGDDVLRQIAEYLSDVYTNAKLFRPSAGTLNISARIGGDEFIKIVPNVSTESEAEEIAKKILNDFHPKVPNQFIEKYELGISIGVALYPQHSSNYHVLVKYADVAMYHAKRAGKHTYRVFNFDMDHKPMK